jgi:hypothetical protein
MNNELLIGKNLERSGCGVTGGTVLAFVQGDCGKPSKTSGRIAGLWDNI